MEEGEYSFPCGQKNNGEGWEREFCAWALTGSQFGISCSGRCLPLQGFSRLFNRLRLPSIFGFSLALVSIVSECFTLSVFLTPAAPWWGGRYRGRCSSEAPGLERLRIVWRRELEPAFPNAECERGGSTSDWGQREEKNALKWERA